MVNMRKKKNPRLAMFFREIGKNPGRYVALLSIIALGVGFFSGLRISTDDMIETAGTYLKKQNFYDFRLLSSIGFGNEEILELSSSPLVEAAEGGYSVDALYLKEDGSDAVAKFHSVPQRLNLLSLSCGRLPQNASECVADSRYFSEEQLGQQVRLSPNNQEIKENFKSEEFTVVGLAYTPLYLNYERGTTSLGTGSVSCYIFLPSEAFTGEVYTEAYLSLSEKKRAYTDDYDNLSDARRNAIEELLVSVSSKRYENLKKEFVSEISEGEETLSENKALLQSSKEDLKKLDDGLSAAETAIANLENGILEAERAIAAFPQFRQTRYAEILKELSEQIGAPVDETHPLFLLAKEEADRELDAKENELKIQKDELSKNLEDAQKTKQELTQTRQSAMEKISEYEALLSDAEKELLAAKEDLEAFAPPNTYALDRSSNVGYVCFENDAHIVKGISNVFPVFFFLVASLICSTTMTRMIADERTQIGVLKALGYGSAAIMQKYLLYAGSAAVVGTAFGYSLGIRFIPDIIWKVYEIMYGRFAPLSHTFSLPLLLISLLSALTCSVGVTLLCCKSELSETSASLIRPKAPKAGRRILLEYIKPLWKRMSFLHKVSARNILRYQKRLWMMVLGIGGCTALLLTGFGIRDSVSGLVEDQFGGILHYDYSVTMISPPTSEERRVFEENCGDIAEKILYVFEGSVDCSKDKAHKTAYMVVPENQEELFETMISLLDGKKTIPFPEKGKAVINKKLAQELGLKTGDHITVNLDGEKNASLEVSGICDNYVYNYVYISPQTYFEAFSEEPSFKTAYILAATGTDPYLGGAKLLERDRVANVTVTAEVRNRIGGFLENLNYIVLLVIVCAGLLAFIVLYNLTNINITERTRELATIRVLGFYKNESASYVFRENRVLTLLGALAGLGMGYFLHAFVMDQIKVDMVSFHVHISPLSLFYSLILTFVFEFLVHLLMRRKINRIPMAESLKSVE